MRRLVVPCAFIALLATAAHAEVIRCADPAGNVSYTDGACPAGTRRTGGVGGAAVSVVPAPEVPMASDVPARDPHANAAPPRAPLQNAMPGGPAIIGNSANTIGAASNPVNPSVGDAVVLDDGYGYPGVYGGAYRRPPVPRDQRPRIRHCDATGCRDTQGNTWNRNGQLDRYQSIDGKTCRPVGTTTLCR
ncbi:DUF4124 domain-containing protein [Variovorax sp. J22R133]|uniref:DUF4124 domain-containing protein n=1 Tax=Variovorax brevis TaxID=3053503 RepID=UPI002577F69D|nr:DUF4124 domain-containing protein [Variovorax sp. J22R133]MDM0116468.1 DUF4124 domain-containing protein [Variovorax sp. J22R133]